MATVFMHNHGSFTAILCVVKVVYARPGLVKPTESSSHATTNLKSYMKCFSKDREATNELGEPSIICDIDSAPQMCVLSPQLLWLHSRHRINTTFDSRVTELSSGFTVL